MKTMRITALLLAAALLLSACGAGGTAQSAPDMEALYGQLEESAALPEMAAVSEKRREAVFGIESADCVQAVTKISGDGVRADEIWLIEAADEAAAGRIEALAQTRVEQLARELRDYLPEQYAVVRQAKVLRSGRLVALLISPEAETMEALVRAAFGS